VEGTSPERPVGNAPARESRHGRGGVDTENLVPRGGEGLGEDPAPATEIDDEAVFDARARQCLQEDGSGAPCDLSETGVVDVREVALVEHDFTNITRWMGCLSRVDLGAGTPSCENGLASMSGAVFAVL